MSRHVGEETVLLNLASGTYFGLNLVGARVWQLLSAGESMPTICEIILTEFDVRAESLQNDVIRLLQALLEQGLVVAD